MRFAIDLTTQTGGLPFRIGFLHRLLDQLAQIEILAMQPQGAGICQRNLIQIINHPAQS